MWCLKALCHAIRDDCLLIEATCAHTVNEQGHGGWPISSCTHSNLPTETRSAGCSTSQALYRLSSFYLSVFLHFWMLITEISRVLNLTTATVPNVLIYAACIRSPQKPMYFRGLCHDIGHAHTSWAHFNWIFELMSSLRSNYTLLL